MTDGYHRDSAPHRRPRAARRVLLLAVVAAVIGGGVFAFNHLQRTFFSPACTMTAASASTSFTPEQSGNAALISAVSVKRGLPARAATIALATAQQESKIRNLTYGDRDSLGIFQQRPSQGWGTTEEILDPVYSTNAFYDVLIKIKGYETADITTVAQQVQRSAFGEAYRQHEPEARILASVFTGHSPAGITCELEPPTSATSAKSVAAQITSQFGYAATTGTSDGQPTVTIKARTPQHAWALGQWAVAQAANYGVTDVTVGARAWSRATPGASWSAGADGTTVVITLFAP